MKKKLRLLFFSICILSQFANANFPDDSIYQAESTWQDHNNKTIQLKDYKGKYIVTSMVYLKCKYSCPLTISKMKEVEKGLNSELLKKTHFLLVAFDFKNDSPSETLKYAKKNHMDLTNWTFLTNKNESTLREFSTLIDFKYKMLPNGDYEHSYALVVLSPEGRILGRTDGSEMDSKVVVDLITKEESKATKSN